MKAIKLVIVGILLLIGSSILTAQTIVTGSLTVGGNQYFVDGITIESGGLLIIDGPIGIGPSKAIHIKDGGKLTSTNGLGSISIPSGSTAFSGIVVHPTSSVGGNTNTALEITNTFSITGAKTGILISFSPTTINQKIILQKTTIIGEKTIRTSQMGRAFNRDNSNNAVSIDECFLKHSGTWGLWLTGLKNLSLTNSTLEATSRLILHCSNLRKSLISNCTFNGLNPTNLVGAVFHGDNYDLTVKDNVFDMNANSYVGLGIGAHTMTGKVYDLVVSGNKFSNGERGFAMGSTSYWGGGTDIYIGKNVFQNNAVGISLTYINAPSPVKRVLLQKNHFVNCTKGIDLPNGAIEDLDIFCNTFDNNSTELTSIPEAIHSTTMIAMDKIILKSNFSVSTGNNFHAYIDANYCTSLRVGNTHTNGKENETLNSALDKITPNLMTIYPNPNNGQFNIELKNNDETALIEVYDLMGKQVFSQNNVNQNISIDINDHTKGMYFVRISIGNEVYIEKIIYQ